jgi:diaminohydroxyphosphoribosylaminopyrimidine deaminase/5-amino-6-(5-phosphoribosylamino)uracil reductase
VHVFVREDALEGDMERLERAGAHVHPVRTVVGGGLDLDEVFDVCWETGIRSILCEGGARVTASLLSEGRIQRVYLFVAPFTLGRGGVPAFMNDAARVGPGEFRLAFDPERFGDDVLVVLDREEHGERE